MIPCPEQEACRDRGASPAMRNDTPLRFDANRIRVRTPGAMRDMSRRLKKPVWKAILSVVDLQERDAEAASGAKKNREHPPWWCQGAELSSRPIWSCDTPYDRAISA